jgi:hypothetical protein
MWRTNRRIGEGSIAMRSSGLGRRTLERSNCRVNVSMASEWYSKGQGVALELRWSGIRNIRQEVSCTSLIPLPFTTAEMSAWHRHELARQAAAEACA